MHKAPSIIMLHKDVVPYHIVHIKTLFSGFKKSGKYDKLKKNEVNGTAILHH